MMLHILLNFVKMEIHMYRERKGNRFKKSWDYLLQWNCGQFLFSCFLHVTFQIF